jgi:general secretion pathway protein K
LGFAALSTNLRSPSTFHKQRGVVLIVVLLIVALVTIIATQISGRLLLNERRSANLQHSDQAWQYVLGAESLAAGHLKKALEQDKDRVHLGQAWAKGKFAFPIEGGQLTGEIIDMSTCFNLNSLLYKDKGASAGETAKQQTGEVKKSAGVQLLEKLFDNVLTDVPVTGEALAAALVDWIDEDSEVSGGDGAEDYEYTGLALPYRTGNGPLGAVSELRTIKGFDAEVYQQLRPFVCALPDVEYNRINVNTLPVERAALLTMLVENLSVEAAEQVLASRPKDGFASESDFWIAPGMPAEAKPSAAGKGKVSFSTRYFLVQAEAVVGRGRARVESLLKAEDEQKFVVVSRAFSEE